MNLYKLMLFLIMKPKLFNKTGFAMFAYFLLILISLTVSLQAQIANVVPEKTLLLNQKVTNLGDVANVYVDDFFNYYVLSKDNKNINIFNSSGDFVKKIPSDNNTKLFDTPVDICVQKNGKIAVLDRGLKRIIIVNQDGERQSVFGNSGSNLGNLDNPSQIEFDAYGNFYVFDKGNKTVIKFNKQGLYRGAISAKNCIAFAVGLDQNIHLLTKADQGFLVQVYYPNFTIKTQFLIRNLSEPTDFLINKFNQYYIVDTELCSVFQYDSTGVPTGVKIGIKGNSGSVGTFSEPTIICNQYVDDSNDKVYIFDEKFSSIQSFNVNFKQMQFKPAVPMVKMDVEFVESQKTDPYKYLFIDNDVFYYILNDNTLLAKKGSEEIFRLNTQAQKQKGINLSEPIALTVFNNKVYIVDNDDDKVVVIDSKNGFNLSQFGESGSNEGQLNSPNDIVADNNGKIYVSDYKNSRVNVYNEQGMYVNKILLTNNRPIKLAMSKLNTIFILLEDKKSIFYLESEKNKVESLQLAGLSIDFEIGTIASIDENMLLVYDDYYGVIHVFDNYKKISEFISRGENEAQMPNINIIATNINNNSLFVSSTKINVQKQFRLLIPPAEPKDAKINISNEGIADLVWIGDTKRASSYLIYRKKQDEKDFQLFTKVESTSLLLDKPTENIMQYGVIAETKDGLQSKMSNIVDDEISYLQFLKDYQPQQAIKRLQELKEFNPIGIVNKISLIYRELIEKYSSSSNWDMMINTLGELIKVKPDESSYYIELANAYKTLLRYSDGIRVLNDAKIRFSDNLAVYQNLIRLQYLNKDYVGTIAQCKEALTKFADNEKIMQSLAEAYLSNNQKEEALQVYRDLSFKTGKEQYFISAGKILVNLGRMDEAIMVYTQAQNTGNAGSELNAALAEAYIAKGMNSDAILQIEKSILVDKTNPRYFYILGLAHSNNRNKQNAITAFEKAVSLDSTQAEYYLALGKDYEIINKIANAQVAYEKAYKLNASNWEVLYRLGKIYLDLKKYDQSCKLLVDANKLLPENKEIKDFLDKAMLTREKYNAKRDPIEIDNISITSLFPSLFNYYKTNQIGSLTIFNTKNEPFDDIRIEITSPELLDEPAVTVVPMIIPMDFKEVLVYARLKDAIIKKSIDGPKDYNVNIAITYKYKEKEQRLTQKTTVKVYSLNSISWEDKKRIASFISANDENVRSFITGGIIAKFSDIPLAFPKIPKPILQTAMVWEYFRSLGITYVQDPNSSYQAVSESNVIDYVQFASQTIDRKTGDCDDLVTLMCSSLESIGINTAVVDVPGHVFMAFDTGLTPDKLLESGINENMLIIRNNTVWLPLETTVIGKNSFIESWEVANKRYNETLKSTQRLELIEIRNAVITYPPLIYPGGAIGLNTLPNYQAIGEKVKEDLTKFMSNTSQNLEVELLAILEKYPKNIHVANKLGLYYARNGKFQLAEVQFLNVLVEKKTDMAALINLGNVYYIQKNYDKAESYFTRAILLDENNTGLLVNMAKLYLAMGKQVKAKEYFAKAEKLNPEIVKQYPDIIKRFN